MTNIIIDYTKTCKIDQCNLKVTSKVGMCKTHYQYYRALLRQGLEEQVVLTTLNEKKKRACRYVHRTCNANDCDKPHYAKGLCRLHYTRQLRSQSCGYTTV